MSRYIYQRLGLGATLNVDQVYDPISNVAGAIGLSGANVNDDKDQITQRAPVHIPIYLPYLGSRFVYGVKAEAGWGTSDDLDFFPYYEPIPMAPLQGDFSATSDDPGDENSQPRLSQISISHDQRGENGSINDCNEGEIGASIAGADTSEGTSLEARKSRMDVKVVIFRKRRTFYLPDGSSSAGTEEDPTHRAFRPNEEVFSLEVSSTLISAENLRQNPFVQKGINIPFNPNYSYIIGISAPDLYDGSADTERQALPSLLVDLKFLVPLTEKDSGTLIQNIPDDHDGADAGKNLSVSTPLANSEIEAEGTDGVSSQLYKVDEYLDRVGYQGGYGRFSNQHAEGDTIATGAAWDVITVPMFANQKQGQITKANIADTAYQDAVTPFNEPIVDRRLIRIRFPFVVHHVIAAVNYQSLEMNETADFWETAHQSEYTHQIGVGMATMGDHLAYTQIAYLSVLFNTSTGGTAFYDHLIDRIGPGHTVGPANPWRPVWDLLSVPLVRKASGDGVGYAAQGQPFFVGPALGPTQSRRQVGTTSQTAKDPETEGMETHLEVRWRITSTVAWDDVTHNNSLPHVGYQGNRVYLIGKKHLV